MLLRTLGPVSHGIIDYAMVIILVVGPRVAGFTGKQAMFCYLLAAVHLAMTLLTRFPLAAMKIIGFPLHGVIEALVSILLIVLPWIANFARGVHSRNFFVAIGLLIGVIALLTNYRGVSASSTISSKTSSSSSSKIS